MTTATSAVSTDFSSPLTRNEISGDFSLIGNGPITIDSAPGALVRVQSGLIQICHPEECGEQLVRGGESVVLDRSGPVAIAAISRAQLRIEWPALKKPQVALAHEPVELYAFA